MFNFSHLGEKVLELGTVYFANTLKFRQVGACLPNLCPGNRRQSRPRSNLLSFVRGRCEADGSCSDG
jgi:hypothetical protein